MSAIPAAGTFDQLNFTGGFPSSVDLAPSIIFFILYALSVPVFGWRVFSSSSRDLALIRPGIFVLCRLGTLGLRAVMSKNSYSVSELVAELILVSIGYLFLISTLVSLWNRNVDGHLPPPQPFWVTRLSRITQLVVLASIITAIAGGSSTSSAFDDQSKLNTVIGLRHANVILSLVAIALCTIGIALTQATFPLPTRETTYLYLPAACLIIVSVYRVCQNFITGSGKPVQSKAAFWVLEMLFEFIAYVCFIAISLPEWYPKTEHTAANEEFKKNSRGGRRGRGRRSGNDVEVQMAQQQQQYGQQHQQQY